MLRALALLLAFLFATPLHSAIRIAAPEVTNNEDDDLDGQVDEESPASCLASDGSGNYRVHFKDCSKVGYANEADSSFNSALRVTKPAGTAYTDGEIAVSGTVSAATYKVKLYGSSPAGIRACWIKSASTHGHNLDNANAATFLPEQASPGWFSDAATIKKVGSNSNFKDRINSATELTFVHGGGTLLLFIKCEADVRLGGMFLTATSGTTPTLPGETTPPPGVDPPVVTSPAIPAGTVERSTFIMTATTDQDGTCRVHWGLSSGSYTISGVGVASQNGQCSAVAGNLTANTTYFAEMRVTNANGTGDSTEVSVTTDAEAPTAGCDYFAGATTQGSANGSSDGNRFLINSFWAVAAPGKKLCLADGIYTGANSMITPPSGLSGNSLAPIIIAATNDGEVTIDGQNARNPLLLRNNDYFQIEGINVKRSSGTTVLLSDGADNNTLKRIVAWDGTSAVLASNNNSNNVFEDVAGFGVGRKIFSTQGASGTIFRRAWGAWQSSAIVGPKSTFQIGYDSDNELCENCVGTWQTSQSPIDQPTTIFRIGAGVLAKSNNRYIASLGYLRSSGSANLVALAFATNTIGDSAYRHVVLNSEISEVQFDVRNVTVDNDGPCSACDLTNTTEVAGSASVVASEWTTSNRVDVASVTALNAASANPFQASGSNGARYCFEYSGGTITAVKAWPWRMQDRINAAITAAGLSPSTFFRGSGNTVTSEIETQFGTIPAACKN